MLSAFKAGTVLWFKFVFWFEIVSKQLNFVSYRLIKYLTCSSHIPSSYNDTRGRYHSIA